MQSLQEDEDTSVCYWLTIIFQFVNELINEQSIYLFIFHLPQTGTTPIAKPTPNGICFVIAYIYIVLRIKNGFWWYAKT